MPLFAAPAQAATTWQVTVGKKIGPTAARESMRFFPGAISVYQGDVLHFESETFHDVAILPASIEDPAEWAASYATGMDGAWSVFSSDVDEGEDAAKANLRVVTPSDPCGWPSQTPCSFDGAGDPSIGVVNSGLPLFATAAGTQHTFLDFSVEIMADPGSTLWAIDPVHPGMTMRIDVLDFTAEPTLAGPQTDDDALYAGDVATANRLHQQYVNKRISKKVNGVVTWSAWAGIETPTVSLRGMYPSKLTIKKNQRVRWFFSKNLLSSHTVSFPQARASQLAASFPEFACDPDGDGGLAEDEAPVSEDPPYCEDPFALELDVPAGMVTRQGNGRVQSAIDFESSGVKGAGISSDKSSYTLGFPKPARKSYGYVCMIHATAGVPMKGSIMVKAPR